MREIREECNLHLGNTSPHKGYQGQHGHNHQGHLPALAEGNDISSDEGAEIGEEDGHLVSYT